MASHRGLTTAFLLALTLIVFACSPYRYRLQEPQLGVTKAFRGSADSTKPDATYDWNRLKGNVGLYVFSYQVRGYTNSMLIGGAKLTEKKGLRIWEHEFAADTPESLLEHASFQTAEQMTNTGSLLDMGLNSKIDIPCLYIRGHIVYGGQLNVVAAGPDPSENPIDTLYDQFLARFAKEIQDVPVDTFRVRKR